MKRSLSILGFAIIFTFGVVALVSATNHWVFIEPTQAPPAGNVAPPLNAGAGLQAKLGGLILGKGSVPVGLLVEQGRVGIGMTDINQVNARLTVFGDVSVRGPINQPSPYLTLGDNTTDSLAPATYIGPIAPPDTCDGDDNNVYVCAADDAITCDDVSSAINPFNGNLEYWKRITTCSIDNNAYGLRTNAGVLEIGLTSTPSTPFMVINDTGNVGIGTTNPQVKFALGDTDTGLHWISDGELAVYSNNVERVRFAANGNVGIGTASPAGKLDVNGHMKVQGNIHMTGAMVGSAWTGYKWVPNGTEISCTTNSGVPGARANVTHYARVNNGQFEIKVSIRSSNVSSNLDTPWINTLYKEAHTGVDSVTNLQNRSSGVTGGAENGVDLLGSHTDNWGNNSGPCFAYWP
jgi:hypothetical protein